MANLSSLQLKNFNIAVPTAFYWDESLNMAGTLAHIQHLIEQGLDSFLVCGSTGEQHSLSLSEKLEMVDTLEEWSGFGHPHQGQIQFGVAAIRQTEAITLAKRVAESSVITGILLAFSPYIRPSQEEAYRYAIHIIEAADKPTILYNNPARTGFDLSADNIIALSKHPLVEGIKDPGDSAKMAVLKANIQKPFHYLAGGESNLLPKFHWGYNGISSVLGNLFPQNVSAILEAVMAQDFLSAEKAYEKLLTLMAPLSQGTLLVEIKKQLNQQGIDMGICRSPLGN